MPIPAGTHTFGPDNAKLIIKTVKSGAASKAGHNLTIEVTAWEATLLADDDQPQLSLTADSSSLRVLEGTGGIKGLTDEDKSNIKQTIDDEVLKRCAIEFRSSAVQASPDGAALSVSGELAIGGKRHPIAFELSLDGGRLSGSATVKQTDWGIKPYSALFGTLKVGDNVQVIVDATIETP